MQINDIFKLSDKEFSDKKDEKLKKANLIIKDKIFLDIKTLIIFNKCIIIKKKENGDIYIK